MVLTCHRHGIKMRKLAVNGLSSIKREIDFLSACPLLHQWRGCWLGTKKLWTNSWLIRVLTAVGTKVVRTPEAAERGTLVTVMAAASAAGQTIPPMYIFPRKRHQDQWVTLGPVGSIGHATSSGWQDEKGFLKYLTHLQAITRCTKDCPILFIMDNFFAHLCPEVLIYAKYHGIILLTTPAHCTHRLQSVQSLYR